MKIIPAIDLIDGKCVRLYQGNFNQSTIVGNDPEAQLQSFIQAGAQMVHIVDLNGARIGAPKQLSLIKKLAYASPIPIQVGGGIRSLETVENYLQSGVSRIVLGTTAIENQEFLVDILKRYPDQVAIGIDAKNEQVAANGWETVVDLHYIEFAKKIEQLGAKTIIYTDISKDGTLSGPSVEQLQRLNETVECNVIASGGIRNNEDLRALSRVGLTEAIVGKAIYDGMITL